MGIKLDSLSPGEADALFNWWGDSTGPYHPALNPAGLGVAVGDRVLFDPWHRDTLFLQSAPERDPIIPADDHLEIFPNPFNHETRIRLTVFNPTDVRIDILNLLGQRVFPLFTGIVMHSRDFAFNGDDLPSGIYFVRAADTITDSQIAMAKLVLLK
jgi:hypothetical protein